MDKLIDFDALFSVYLNDWYAENKDKYEDFGDLEEAAAGVYGQWINEPLDKIKGVSPFTYFEKITDPKELVALTVKYVISDISPSILLCDRIAKVKECAPLLTQIIRLNENAELTIMAANILTDMQDESAFPIYIDWIFDKIKDKELIALGIEKLAASPETSGGLLLQRMDKQSADIETYKNIADVLVHHNKDERIYNLLVKLFKEGSDLPLYAAYLGKYGDKRALPLLIEYGEKQTINYLEYMEIRNAAESMGGEVVNKKDFKNDKYFKALKNT